MTTGIVGHTLQVYVSIPTYESTTGFLLYEVISLPEVANDHSRQVTYAGLPDFLAVSTDEDKYLELRREDVADCLKYPRG